MYSGILAIGGLFILVSSPIGACLLMVGLIIWFASSFPILFVLLLLASVVGFVYYLTKEK